MAKTNPIKVPLGIALIEVLVSIVILAIGLLGIANMLILAQRSNTSSYMKQQAVQCIYDIFDKMKANSQAAINGSYNVSNIGSSTGGSSSPPVNCAASICTSTQLASFDTWYWLNKDLTKLPNGQGSVTTALSGVSGNTLVTVTVQWDDSVAQNKLGAIGATGSAANFVQLTIQSQL